MYTYMMTFHMVKSRALKILIYENPPKICFLEKVNKINNPVANLANKKKDRTQITNTKNKRGDLLQIP